MVRLRFALCAALLAVTAGIACLDHPTYTARGFQCRIDADCDATTVCILSQCRWSHAYDGSIPDETTTGVPKGTTLTASGDLALKVEGGVADALDIKGCVRITANGVTLRRSRVFCDGGDAVALAPGITGTVLEDVELVGTPGNGVAVNGDHFRLERADVHGFTVPLPLNAEILIEDSYVHGLPAGYHLAVQGNSAQSVYILHNRIVANPKDGRCIEIDDALGPVKTLLIQANLFSGGAICVQVVPKSATNVQVLNNRFGQDVLYNALELSPVVTASGNVWSDTGEPASQ